MVTSAIRGFRSEFEAGYRRPANELFPYERSAIFFKAAPVPTGGRTASAGGLK
jgi:NADH-quinone oxidoreductase subunit F